MPPAILEVLDRTAREVQKVRADKNVILMSLWNQFAQQAPELLGALAAGIARNEPGPLDNALDFIVDRWVEINPDDAFAWVREAVRTDRTEVRLAIAAGFARAGWQHHAEEFSAVWIQGLSDEDPDVVQAFLSGAGGYLRTIQSKPSTSCWDTTFRPSEPAEYSRTHATTTAAHTGQASTRRPRPRCFPSSPEPASETTWCRRS
jgi:hypothetical protein